jgi:hypothetical protein
MYVQNAAGAFPAPGSVVSSPLPLWLRHRGVVSDRWHRGKPMVISGSARAGCVCEESWDDFADGQPVKEEGYPSALPPWEVLRRVRSLIGTPYRLFDWNCDHVVAVAHGRKPESPQLVGTAAIAAVVALVLAASSR